MAVNFYNTLLVISTVYCGEFNQGLMSDCLIAADFIKPLGPVKLKSEVWHILRLKIVIDFIKAGSLGPLLWPCGVAIFVMAQWFVFSFNPLLTNLVL